MTEPARNFEVVRLRRSAIPVKKPERARPAALTHVELLSRVVALKEQAKSMRPPENHHPERWHEDKSDHVREIEKLEDDIRRGGRVP